MQIVIERHLANFVRFQDLAGLMKSPKFRLEMSRGVTDAGRKTRTQVQRAVAKQMAVSAGGYSGYVVPNMRGISRPQNLSFTILARGKGDRITTYKGLRALSPTGRLAKKMNAGEPLSDQGFVRSGVWNRPRVFKRSFASSGGFFALIPSDKGSGRLPKAFWTYGHKPGQPRGADGKFAASRVGFRVRTLFGPSIGKELDKDSSLQVFMTFGPKELDMQVTKRVEKFMRF